MLPVASAALTAQCSCRPQEDFKPLAKAMDGFAYAAERPDAPDFVGQKWGYRGEQPGERAMGGSSRGAAALCCAAGLQGGCGLLLAACW